MKFSILSVKRRRKHQLRKYLDMMVGTFFMPSATNIVFEPFGIVTGRFSRIGVILRKLSEISLWITHGLLNLPVFLLHGIYVMAKITDIVVRKNEVKQENN